MIAATPLFSQFTEYKPLTSTGEMPLSFRTMTYDKVKADLEKIQMDDSDKRQAKKSKQEFLLASNYQIDRILLSGKVLYNDPVGSYVNEVAEKIYDVEPELRNQLEIYVVKSPRVNAFTTQRGVIMVTLGLLAQLENESQLAFVLCHEMVHYKKNHVMKKHMHNFELQRSRNKSNSYHEKILSQSTYSREHEFEADREGFKIYQQLGYSLSEVEGIFNVLQYGYLPFDEVPFQPKWLETKSLKFSDKYRLQNVKPISPEESYNDFQSSHPNIQRRKEAMQTLISASGMAEGAVFILPEERFTSIRQQCRYELSRLYLANLEFENSLYNTYLLSRKNPNDLYLKKIMVKALYMYSKVKTNAIDENSTIRPVVTEFGDVEGESQRLAFLLQHMTARELTIATINKAWQYYLETKDPVLKTYAYSALKSLVFEHDASPEDFFRQSKTQLLADTDTSIAHSDNKYRKIEKSTFLNKLSNSSEFDFAFVHLFKNKEFSNLFKQYNDEKQASYHIQDGIPSRSVVRRNQRTNTSGIKRVVMVNPFYTSWVNPREPGMELVRSEMRRNKVIELYKHNSKRLNLDLTVISTDEMQPGSTEMFNEMSALNDWIVEWTTLSGLDDYVNSNTEYIQDLPEKYGTDYFLWSGFEAATHKRKNVKRNLGLSLLFPPLLPVAVWHATTPAYHTNVYFVLFNIKENNVEIIEASQFSGKDRMHHLNSRIYKFLKKTRYR